MTEAEFQIVKSVGFVLALALAVWLQRLSPHRALAGSWRSNSGLWAINAVALGAVCAGCACTVSRWASVGGVGLLNQAVVSSWVAIPISVLAMDFVSYFWHRANHLLSFLWRFHQTHHTDPDYTVTTPPSSRFQRRALRSSEAVRSPAHGGSWVPAMLYITQLLGR